jgi:DMSO reductase family type II enzyme heme b subunit
MQAQYAAGFDIEAMLDPDARPWSAGSSDNIKLIGTPAGMQPTAAIRNAYTGKQIGMVQGVKVSAIHNGQDLAFRLEWEDATQNDEIGDTTSFPDAAAIVLPSVPNAPVITMGAPDQAVNAWYWRADEKEGYGRQVIAEGLGSSRTIDREIVRTRGSWKDGRWQVVIARPLKIQSPDPVAQIQPGEITGFGVAIWEGSAGERAGIKAFSGNWIELALDGVSTARR